MDPYRIIRMLGGMIGPSEPAAACKAATKGRP